MAIYVIGDLHLSFGVNKPMDIVMEEGASEDYLAWFKSQYYYSYEVKHLPWTRLGYTYDWSKEAKGNILAP